MGFLDRFRKPTPDRFAAQMMAGIRAAGVAEELRYDPDQFCIRRTRDGEDAGETNLGNMFQHYKALRRPQRAAYLQNCVRAALTTYRELPKDFDAAKPDLRVKFWNRAAIEHLRLKALLEKAKEDAVDTPGELIGAHLLACPVFDWPESSQSLRSENLADWGVTVYEALEAGRQNLDETLEGYAKFGDGLYLVQTGDSYDAARLTLVDRIRTMEVKGQHVAMVPNRDTLLITGSDDEAGLTILAAMAEEGLKQPYPLSGAPLILDEDSWRDWMPPADHSLYRTFRTMETNWLGPQYTDQKHALEALHESQGTDIYVASFSAVKRQQDGAIVSYCVWGEGVDALLPVTQKVMILRDGQQKPAALGDWERVREVAGSLMEETDHYPPRCRVREFPSQAMLDAIGVGEM